MFESTYRYQCLSLSTEKKDFQLVSNELSRNIEISKKLATLHVAHVILWPKSTVYIMKFVLKI